MTPGLRKLLEVGRRRVTLVEPCPLDLTHTLARPPTTDVSLAVAPAHRGTIAAAPPAQGAPSSLVKALELPRPWRRRHRKRRPQVNRAAKIFVPQHTVR